MANRAVQILISARDTASASLKQVQGTIRSVAATMRRVTFAAPVAALKTLRAAASAAIIPMIKLTLMLAPFLALAGAVRLFGRSLGDFGRQQAAVRNLATSLELVGANVREALPDLTNFASELQQVTTQGDEATLELMRNGLMLGIQTEQIKGATQAAIGLSEALGIDQTMAMRAVANANEGQFEVLQRYLPALKTATDDTEKLAIVNEAAAKGFALAKSQTQTYAGAMAQLWNAVGDTREVLGEALAPAIMKVAGFIRGILPTIEKWIKSTAGLTTIWQSAGKVIAAAINGIAAVFRASFNFIIRLLNRFGVNVESVSGFVEKMAKGIVTAINFLARAFVTGLAVVDTIINNWREILDLALVGAALSIVKFGETLKFWFTEVIPNNLGFMAGIMVLVFAEVGKNITKQLLHIGANIGKFAASIPGLLAGTISIDELVAGSGGGPKITDGLDKIFRFATHYRPKTGDRTKSGFEIELENHLAGGARGLKDKLKEQVDAALKQFDGAGALINPGDLAASIFIGLTGKAEETIGKGIGIDTARTGAEESRFLTLGPRVSQEPAVATAKNTEQVAKLNAKQIELMQQFYGLIQNLTSNGQSLQLGSIT